MSLIVFCEPIQNPIKMGGDTCLRLDMNRSPKAGQPVTYILTYEKHLWSRRK